VTLKA
jgi:hypothetical protein